MTGPDQPLFRRSTTWWRLAVALAVALFIGAVARFYIPGKGFTSLILFGENFASGRLTQLADVDYFSSEDSFGYDGQFYAQLAVQPNLRDPALNDALDNLPYRARRMLFCWTAYALGLGQPAWVLHVFSLQNVVCWLALAVLLLRWFPPVSGSNFLRWAGVLFSVGVIFSVRGSLVDAPSLLLIAGAMACLEAGRPWLAAAGLGVAGLGRETSLLAGGALAWPADRSLKGWGAVLGRGLLAVAPLTLWLAYLAALLKAPGLDSGARNFALPFTHLVWKIETAFAALFTPAPSPLPALSSFTMVATLLAQFLFFALRPRWRDPWWRLGAAYAVLMVFLGRAVWEGEPGAASRVLLPMQLAFNLTVPRGGRWFAVLLLGNLSAIGSVWVFQPPLYEEPILEGPPALLTDRVHGRTMRLTLDDQWLPARHSHWDSWRWTTGTATVVVHNPHPFPLRATLTFRASTATPRGLRVTIAGTECWRAALTTARLDVPPLHLTLFPGDTPIRFETDRPGDPPGTPFASYPIACRIFDLKLRVDPPSAAPP